MCIRDRLNSANDLGNVGPDYMFGWGHINAFRAARTLEQEHYFKSSVAPASVQNHQLEIPEGVKQLKLMVYWSDPEATVGVSKALINNLDVRIFNVAGVFRPWVLNPSPNATSLNLPAIRGVDNLNNMEQIVIDDPNSGFVFLEVRGTELPFGAHDYYVVYEFVTDDVTITYPIGGEGLIPGNSERIHWDAFGNEESFFVLSSLDGGATWQQIAEVAGTDRMFDWVVPNEFTGQAKIRISRQGIDTESGDFSISPVPTGLQVIEACPSRINLTWDELPNAIGYKIFKLGETSMDDVGTAMGVNTFEYALANPDDLMGDHYFAIAALGDNGLESERSIATLYNCLLYTSPSPRDATLSRMPSSA